MIQTGSTIDNRTICDLFGVGNTGGIRVCKARNLIVLISNNTDPLYRNEWKDDVLHFVGRGSTGPQKLDRQNKTLANATRSGMALHLFEVFEKSKYVYAGEVELAAEPYMSDQTDVRDDSRFIWIFPLRRKAPLMAKTDAAGDEPSSQNHLPHGAYAVIGSGLTPEQLPIVNEALDRLRAAGITVLDGRDIDRQRYEKALASWHDAVLDRVRSTVRELLNKRKRAAKDQNRVFALVDDELRINSASTEVELRAALKFLDRDDVVAMEEVFEEARQSVPMPEVPKSLLSAVTAESADDFSQPMRSVRSGGRKDFSDFT